SAGWRAGTGSTRNQWNCQACRSRHWFNLTDARRHEQTRKHRDAVAHRLKKASQVASTSAAPPPTLGVDREATVGPLAELLQDVTARIDDAPPESLPDPEAELPSTGLDWETLSAELGGQIAPSHTQAALSGLTATLTRWLIGGEGDDTDSDDAGCNEAQEEAEEGFGVKGKILETLPVEYPLSAGVPRSARNTTQDHNWYPWPDKQTCVLDIIRHLPRSLFSDSQMEIILWCLEVLGVDNLPSLFVLKTLDKMLQSHCGIESIRQRGPLGHVYYVNDLAAILAQEMANPRVRPYLRFYPEDAGSHMKEGWHAARWLRELSPEIATPMIRIGEQDFYVNEPAKLHDGRVVIPRRWFTRAQAHLTVEEPSLHGEGWLLHPVTFQDGHRGYIVHEEDTVSFSSRLLSLSFPLMVETFQTDNLPDPRTIIGRKVAGEDGIHPWTYTDPHSGNPWRLRARGHRVVSLLMWMYCDDTSGNMSKKWNKHNSWLFTLAGLPRALAHQESNVHFLATSNIAPPLEMLHGIVGQLEKGQTEGFWAWDILHQEMVLVIPAVLAILGDNPMQSEIACHVGLTGRLFCRNCMVRGKERGNGEDVGRQQTGHAQGDKTPASSAEESASSMGSGASRSATKRSRKETMQELVDRARRFLGDTFQEFFLERIFAFGRKLRGSQAEKQALLDAFIMQEIPDEICSPVWKIKDLDPHQDTPVEILHVVLLGFIKYFWRDAVARVPSDKKDLLKARLSSLDVSGLGIPPLSGETLVSYAGSLTGRDFRAISQVAPFVLYDMVPQPCYQAWQALSALVPLIWQPEIDDLDDHLERLQAAIDYFLDCTARWTPRWFNKPKFHVLRHLVDHIRRFGPAVLFATEGFESFNAIIRSKSIHSNHQAPSRDIARAFARVNRIRHLLCGGVFIPHTDHLSLATSADTGSPPAPFSDNPSDWRSAGPLPMALLRVPRANQESMFGSLLPDDDCLAVTDANSTGTCVLLSGPAIKPAATLTSTHVVTSLIPPDAYLWRCASCTDAAGDTFKLSGWILVRDREAVPPLCIGRVTEILQVHGSKAFQRRCADVVLIERFVRDGIASPYGLPRLLPAGWRAVDPTVTSTRAALTHNEPHDVLLNTFQMRSAVHLQQLRHIPQPLNRDHAILTGARAEIDAQKASAATQPASKGKAISRQPRRN
ncbi:hypothetical protein BV20DRAFT_958926, partial [Pilatotrama ljubarskyi]